MTIIRRSPRPLPLSERVHAEVAWVEPAQVATPWWRRILSSVELVVLVVVLGVVLTIAIGLVLLATFFVFDYLIS